jgi:hypothetical protein
MSGDWTAKELAIKNAMFMTAAPCGDNDTGGISVYTQLRAKVLCAMLSSGTYYNCDEIELVAKAGVITGELLLQIADEEKRLNQ